MRDGRSHRNCRRGAGRRGRWRCEKDCAYIRNVRLFETSCDRRTHRCLSKRKEKVWKSLRNEWEKRGRFYRIVIRNILHSVSRYDGYNLTSSIPLVLSSPVPWTRDSVYFSGVNSAATKVSNISITNSFRMFHGCVLGAPRRWNDPKIDLSGPSRLEYLP